MNCCILSYQPDSCVLLPHPLLHSQNCLALGISCIFHPFFPVKEKKKVSQKLFFFPQGNPLVINYLSIIFNSQTHQREPVFAPLAYSLADTDHTLYNLVQSLLDFFQCWIYHNVRYGENHVHSEDCLLSTISVSARGHVLTYKQKKTPIHHMMGFSCFTLYYCMSKEKIYQCYFLRTKVVKVWN